MSVKAVALGLSLFVGGCAAPPPVAAESSGSIAPSLAAACAGRDGWSDPAPPARIIGNLYYVGTCGITSLLVTSRQGHVLIDGGPPDAAPLIAANIRRLGFNPRDVRYLLNSHEHLDHAGGLAALKQLSGAKLVARAEARSVLESGKVDPRDPQAGAIPGMPGVAVDRVIADGETVRLGPIALTAHATPGHTDGGTSWSWRVCEAGRCSTVTFVDSLTPVSADGYRFTDHPERVAPFRATFDRVARLDCDILITPHPSASNLFPRLAGRAPLVDRGGCAAYAQAARKRLDDRLASEAAR
ncbi:MAG TPA: subclass B3 metallo-beta-lactamase [Allosphingosinicella sp.]|jgi:metallo-beta-lactamase class B|uniref:subclass B3 metallo-beta-lactamase n=1 Tax=Allosphingosinicella sp. TaxID=2823234 RepID=UPI002F2AD9E6